MSGISDLSRNSRVIAVVGLSSKRPGHYGIAEYMQKEQGYRIIPVNPNVSGSARRDADPRLDVPSMWISSTSFGVLKWCAGSIGHRNRSGGGSDRKAWSTKWPRVKPKPPGFFRWSSTRFS